MTSLVVVDDQDPRITYEGAWLAYTNSSEYEYNNTEMRSNGTSDTATFSFMGTWISVYGTTGSCRAALPGAEYIIDGGTPVQYATPSMPDVSYHYQMFASEILPDGNHTLVFRRTDPDTTCSIVLDFIEYAPSLQQNASASPSASPSSNHISAAALAGGLAGGIGGLLLLVTLGLFLRRSRQEVYRKQDIIDGLISARPYAPVPSEPQLDIPEPPPYGGRG